MSKLPVGSKIKLDCGSVPAPEHLPDSQRMGWAAFFRGAVSLTTDPEIDPKLYELGWRQAKTHKLCRESLVWEIEAYETDSEGSLWALLIRWEPRCLDDVYNGTGTGLGTIEIREKVRCDLS
jgi:hypothetical protein